MADEVEVAKAGIDLVEKYADKLTDVLSQYSGPAADLALAVGRVGALKEVVSATAFLITAAVIGFYVAKAIRFIAAGVKSGKEEDVPAIAACCLLSAAGAIGAAIFGVVGILNIFNMYAWVGMFHPEVYLAAKALGL